MPIQQKKIGDMVYEGKAKRFYVDKEDSELAFLEYKDSLTAFNAQKKGSFAGKGSLNCQIAALIFSHLEKNGVATHFKEMIEPNWMRVKKMTIIPLEVVVRNRLAGSTAKKLGMPEGGTLKKPLLEFYYKKDELADPFVSDDQILEFDMATPQQLATLKEQALRINFHLQEIFSRANLILVDFKIEFGVTGRGEILLADEITPDCCRLWDKSTLEKYDKDRFRRDLGNVSGAYEEVHLRLRKALS